MDKKTLAAYDDAAASFADDWLGQPAPDDMYRLLSQYFRPGPTADIGCGAGRDVAWLAANGFDACGYDASEGLLSEARMRYPKLRFDIARLPELANIAPGTFENVLCETVVMHLDPERIGPAVRRLRDILKPGGTLYLSWRVTEGESERDKRGRLYSAFDKRLVMREIGAGDTVLLDREDVSASSGKVIHRLVVKRSDR
ncbi:class I SAM-dependent methyltransferase [Trinickia violacea]|uniref:Class I SAM-dependent methyltransferase n=1 Tax=Trinickia violacea TaxID=2571746 RepID=A0A4P8IN30_9BURK|nr:class I SAM-dependent methyltransferase [Trinickia violacea]QCP48244.1 class I SAM-dependent methyltransferase [Trinickia violacea]